MSEQQNRREFLSRVALGTMGTIGAGALLNSCASARPVMEPTGRFASEEDVINMRNEAPDGPPLRAGLIGCGGRGTGAAINFVDAGPNLEIVALADVFQDQLDGCRKNLKEARDIDVANNRCYVGFDAYKDLLHSGIDIVLIATPPIFRAEHVREAIEADVHIFQEKPVAIDPSGTRYMTELMQQARDKGLCQVTGTVRKYQKDYIETRRRVANGAIGEVTGATFLRNGGALWWVERRPEWSDLEYMLRNWGNFQWASGDHIIEMFIHELDVMNWYMDGNPESAFGYGGRHQRQSGDMYDFFSVEYNYGKGKRVTCAVRQINGMGNGKREIIQGSEGYADASGIIYNLDGEEVWRYPHPREQDADQRWAVTNPFVQEHIELVTAIRTGGYINDTAAQIDTCNVAILGREAAYTGQNLTWDELVNMDKSYDLGVYDFNRSYEVPDKAPVPGTEAAPAQRYA
ncbi:MAG: Gfo/Idh/MocA family oxidoreductase [Balneolaceae bacterium]